MGEDLEGAKEHGGRKGSVMGDDIARGVDDAAAIPKGTLDPVYEAKARVLNRAVGFTILYEPT
jgi:hypothetical protein